MWYIQRVHRTHGLTERGNKKDTKMHVGTHTHRIYTTMPSSTQIYSTTLLIFSKLQYAIHVSAQSKCTYIVWNTKSIATHNAVLILTHIIAHTKDHLQGQNIFSLPCPSTQTQSYLCILTSVWKTQFQCQAHIVREEISMGWEKVKQIQATYK